MTIDHAVRSDQADDLDGICTAPFSPASRARTDLAVHGAIARRTYDWCTPLAGPIGHVERRE